MNTSKLLIVLCLVACAFNCSAADATDSHKQGSTGAPATTPSSTVSVSANGTDVRLVLHDLFAQTKANYVIEPNVKFVVYLSLDKVDFDEALGILCHLAKIKIDKQNGIYYVSNDLKPTKSLPHPVTIDEKDGTSSSEADVPTSMPVPVVSWKDLRSKNVTTRLPKTSIKKVMSALSDQTGIPIVIDPLVPDYKLDAFLNKTSLKYALDHIMAATHLHYTIIDRSSVRIFVEEDAHITVNP